MFGSGKKREIRKYNGIATYKFNKISKVHNHVHSISEAEVADIHEVE